MALIRRASGRRATDDEAAIAETQRRRRALADVNWDGGPKRSRWETHSLNICADCLFLLANGDSPEVCDDRHHDHTQCKRDEGCSAVERSIEAQWPSTDGWNLMASCSDEECAEAAEASGVDHHCNAEEGFFSHSSCDSCGSWLGGSRYHGTAMREKK